MSEETKKEKVKRTREEKIELITKQIEDLKRKRKNIDLQLQNLEMRLTNLENAQGGK